MSPCLPLIRWNRKSCSRDIYLAILGVDNAGKTTITRSIRGITSNMVVPTMGFDRTEFRIANCNITIYDLGGADSIRAIWQHYFAEIHGVIFVTDSTDINRLDEARTALFKVTSHIYIAGKPILLFANKQDLDGAYSEQEIKEALKVDELLEKYNCPYKVETCCALLLPRKKLDPRILDGVQWLLSQIESSYQKLEERIKSDVENQKEFKEFERSARLSKERHSPPSLAESKTLAGDSGSSIPMSCQAITPEKKVPVKVLHRPIASSGLPGQFRRVAKTSYGTSAPRSVRRSLPLSAQQLHRMPINEHKRQTRRSARSMETGLPPINGHTQKNCVVSQPVKGPRKGLLESQVEVTNQHVTEVIEIEELDEVETEHPIDVASNFQSRCLNEELPKRNAKAFSEMSKSTAKKTPMPLPPRTRRVVPIQSGLPNGKENGTTPCPVDPLYGSHSIRSRESFHLGNVNSDGDAQKVSQSLNMKRPSPLARIFTSGVNKLHPTKPNSDGEP